MTARAIVARMMTNGLGVMSDAEETRLLDAFAAEVRAAALTEAADAVEAFTGNPLDSNAKMLRRMAADPTATTEE